MIKSKILKLITLAAGLTAGSFAHAAADGDIFEIRPCTAVGLACDPYATIDTPLTSGETVYFNMRLVQHTQFASSVWRLQPQGFLDKEIAAALSPMQIAVYVSGTLRWADLVEDKTDASTGFTDLIFAYKTRPGDYALPIVLATQDSAGELHPATDTDQGLAYYLNPARAAKWAIVNDDGDTCNLWFRDAPPKPMTSPDGTRIKDFSLAKCGFFVKTIDFDANWESDDDTDPLWRSVHEKSTQTVGKTPSLVATAPVEDAVKLYVWSTDESAVKIKGGVKRTLKTRANPVETVQVTVGEITLAGGQASANFQIEGVSETGGAAGDGKAELVLSPWGDYTYSDETGDRIVDYLTVPVKCIEPLPVSILIERDDASVIAPTAADDAYLTAVTRLTVYATQAPTNDVTVTVQPSFQVDATKTNWEDYLRFSTVNDSVESLPAATVPVVTLEKGKTEKKYIYVYALRAEKAYTIGTGKQIQFTPVVSQADMDNAGIKTLGDPTGIYVDANAPVITSPTAETILTATAGTELKLPIAINDTFADMSDTATGYTVSLSFNGSEQAQATTFVPNGEGNTLVGKDDENVQPKITIPATVKGGEYTVTVKVTSPIRKLTSAVTSFKITVTPAKSSKVETTDAETDYVEGDIAHYKVTMSDAPGEVVYAFLVNYDDAPDGTFGGTGAKAIIRQNQADAKVTTSKGVRINADGTTATGSFTLQDGVSAVDGGSTYQFGVVFCTTQVYDPDKKVPGFPTTDGITITVYNKEPVFDANEPVFVQGIAVGNGGTLENEYPKGQELKIVPNISDVDFDLKHGFKYKYTISRNGKQVKVATVGHEDTTEWQPGADTTIADGTSINKSFITYDFPIAGTYTIKIQLQDKDMRAEGENKFASDSLSFNLGIIDQPQVTIEGDDGRDTYQENELRQHVNVGLSFFPDTGETIVVKLTVTAPAGDNAGVFTLDSTYKTVPTGYPALGDDEYYVVFDSGSPQGLLIEAMDGTQLSSTKGFTLKAEVMNTTESIEAGTAWKDYYKPYTKKFYIDNVAPITSNVTEPGTNAWTVAGGLATSRPIKFGIKSDVEQDLLGLANFPGIKVTITGCDSGELSPAVAAHTNPLEFYIAANEPRSYTFTPNFGSLQGDQTITLTITDKDEGEQTWTYMYTITPSKFLHTLANGPSGGTTTSPLSQKYTLADGIGAGHTYVESAISAGAKNFRLSWNCSKQIYMNVFGFGYKVANPTDDGSLDGMDIAISQTGDSPVIGANYRYPAADLDAEKQKDSYFYCWLLHAQGEQGGVTSSVLGNTIAPERQGVVGRGMVTLPTEQTEDGSYIDTVVEAIFAKEWLPADNLGDINQDGVPDAFAIKTWKGGKLLNLVYGAEDTEVDLNDLAQSNPDEDYLPGVYADKAMSYAPIGVPFSTRLELRGFDNGLNATDYTKSDVSFSKDEQAAYTAATGNAYDPATVDLGQWSPEPSGPEFARMDPTMEDTDGDGFPDGWEYYFWYMAHVWQPAGAEIANPRVGQISAFERFNMANVIVGTPIPAEEVEARFNPCVQLPADVLAKDPDFDKDGLSDLEELAIGTNPCHWDSDGDHMCDGWEVMMCLDPLGVDRIGNEDGDFMASHNMMMDFVWVHPDGNQDPYAEDARLVVITDTLRAMEDYDVFTLETVRDLTVKAFTCHPKYVNGEPVMYGIDTVYIGEVPPPEWYQFMVDDIEQVEITIPEGSPLTQMLSFTLVHDQVMKAFGFDPRTGWHMNANGYCANRWDPSANSDLSPFDTAGYAVNTRAYLNFDEYLTMRYRYNYQIGYPDEKQGFDAEKPWETLIGKTTNPSVAYPKVATDEPADDAAADDDAQADAAADGEDTEKTFRGAIAEALAQAFAQTGSTKRPVTTHGADTDQDGVPDGWELYVARNPNGVPEPMEDGLGLPGQRDYDGDMLSYVAEYAGSDSCDAYRDCESIYANHPGNLKGWFNKFFPTHPGTWTDIMGNPDGADTDADGITDAQEGMTWTAPFFYEGQVISPCEMGFIYGEPVDAISCCIRGGGMNPCTVDTDQDGLPDGWEMAHSGVPVELAGMTPVPPRNGMSAADLEVSMSTKIADGVMGGGEGVYIMGGMDATWAGDACSLWGDKDELLGTVRDCDFDHDGLQNFQEYLVQSMRHFRYDDVTTPLMGRQLEEGAYDGNGNLTAQHTQRFLGYTVFDASSAELTAEAARAAWGAADVVDQHVENAGTGVQQAWDEDGWRALGYLVPPVHYWDRSLTAMIMMNPVYQFSILGAIVPTYGNAGYVTTDPRMADTDMDGMDDYYEMFHGLNPILGTPSDEAAASPILTDGKAGDIISTTYNALVYPLGDSRPTFNAYNNEWMMPDFNGIAGRGGAAGSATRPTGLTGCEAIDPVLYPWTMGTSSVDADGDGLRNDDERIAANQADPLPRHTDPTPAWFTERTTAASYTAQYYVTPSGALNMPFISALGLDDYAGAAFRGNNFTYLYAFEENEGYDTDNDFAPDGHEIVKAVSVVTDPMRHDDPYRRQALYLNGINSYAMSRDTHIRPADAADLFRQFTVECWVNPEKKGVKQTILERSAAYTADANNKDKVAIRANFRIGLAEDGRVYGLFDNSDAIESGLNAPVSCQRIDSLAALPLNAWSHVALTYDGQVLKLFVNGKRVNYAMTTLIPANGVSQAMQDVSWTNTDAFPVAAYKGQPVAFFVGARPQKEADMALTPSYVEGGVHLESFANVREFFKGYVDEIRVWDGARSEVEIAENYTKHMDYKAISDNRDEVFRSWYNEGTRNNNDGKPTLPPELVMHYDFSTLPGALNVADVAQAPVGFDKAVAGQATFGHTGTEVNATGLYPNIADLKADVADALAIGWWDECLQKSTVYKDYRIVPWIENSVARLPALDGAAVDSMYYGENMSAAYVLPSANGLQKYVFPNTGLPYQGYVYNFDRSLHLDRYARFVQMTGAGEMLMKRAEFQVRNSFLGTSELVPLGGAFAKACDKMWDNSPADLWEYTGVDSDEDGLPDWWETYAKAQGYYTGDDLSWDTEVTYNGRPMSAAQAYQIDLYKGVMPVNGVATLKPEFQSTVDSDGDLIPDWWEALYDVREYGAYDDPDGDGLCNYVEYLLSVVFDVGVKFDPLNAYSASATELDYFWPIGKVYAGEIFTDHDMINDKLEDSWGAKFGSRLAWDRDLDVDEDGWSNFAEASYHDFTSHIIANHASHIVGDAEIKDLPIPTLKLRLRYNGSQPLTGGSGNGGQGGQGGGNNNGQADNNSLAPIVVQTFTREGNVVPDATFNVQPGEALQNTVYLGAWSDRVVSGTLTPGYVNPGTFKIEFAEVDRNDDYTFEIKDLTALGADYAAAYPAGVYGGSYETYMAFYEMFGHNYVVLQSAEFAWNTFQEAEAITVTQDESGEDGYICCIGERMGNINLMTGAFSLNLKGLERMAVKGTNSTASVGMSQMVLRVVYDSVVPKLQSNKLDLYLGEAPTGYVKEGKNTIVAFYDLDGDGKYTAGEPFGCAMDVDVGWHQGVADIELTDTSPIITRADLLTGTSDRKALYGEDDGDYYNLIEGQLSGGKYQRLRVVRTLVNGIGIDQLNIYNRVLVDRWVELDQRSFFCESDVLSNGELDLDWSTLYDEVVNSSDVKSAGIDPTDVTYRIVLGNGSIDVAETNNLFGIATTRHFDLATRRARPICLSPGQDDAVVYSAQPTFKWTMNGFNSYTAFQLQILSGSTVVWDSGMRRAPAVDLDGNYKYTPDVYIGDVLANNQKYSWRVSMFNAKFKTTYWSETSSPFRTNVPTADYGGYGSLPVCVRYYGPAPKSSTKIRVEAFDTPDFTGMPVARATLASTTDLSAKGKEHKANVTLIGLSAGTYYVRAYIDADSYGTQRICDSWESWGYACPREKSLETPFSPSAVKIVATKAAETVEVYIEDVDTNGNAIPDIYEVFSAGNTKLNKGAVGTTQTLAGTFAWSPAVAGVSTSAGTTASQLLAYIDKTFADPEMAALVLGLEPQQVKVTATGALMVESEVSDVEITSISFADGNVTVKVDAKLEAAADGMGIYQVVTEPTKTVVCEIYNKKTLEQADWELVATKTITVGGAAETLTVTGAADGDSGFYKAVITK